MTNNLSLCSTFILRASLTLFVATSANLCFAIKQKEQEKILQALYATQTVHNDMATGWVVIDKNANYVFDCKAGFTYEPKEECSPEEGCVKEQWTTITYTEKEINAEVKKYPEYKTLLQRCSNAVLEPAGQALKAAGDTLGAYQLAPYAGMGLAAGAQALVPYLGVIAPEVAATLNTSAWAYKNLTWVCVQSNATMAVGLYFLVSPITQAIYGYAIPGAARLVKDGLVSASTAAGNVVQNLYTQILDYNDNSNNPYDGREPQEIEMQSLDSSPTHYEETNNPWPKPFHQADTSRTDRSNTFRANPNKCHIELIEKEYPKEISFSDKNSPPKPDFFFHAQNLKARLNNLLNGTEPNTRLAPTDPLINNEDHATIDEEEELERLINLRFKGGYDLLADALIEPDPNSVEQYARELPSGIQKNNIDTQILHQEWLAQQEAAQEARDSEWVDLTDEFDPKRTDPATNNMGAWWNPSTWFSSPNKIV